MLGYILGAVVLNGVLDSKAKKRAAEEKRKREREISKLKKEIRELKGEPAEGGLLDWLFG